MRAEALCRAAAASYISSRVKNHTFIDYATEGYVALVGLIILCLHNRAAPYWMPLLAAHVVCLALIYALLRVHAAHPHHRVIDFLRHFYPVLLYTALYRETAALNQLPSPGFLDTYFIRLEARVFGMQPSLVFMDALPYLPVSELAYAAYFSYYVMIAGIGLTLFFRNRRQFFHFLSVISFVFYVCYLVYIFTPVIGPRVFFREIVDFPLPPDLQPTPPPTFPAVIANGPFYQIMHWIYRVFESPGAAFPSSHVAVAFSTVFFSFRYLRPIRWLHLGVAVLLSLSTIYCRYHYAVDVLAGALATALLVPVGNLLYLRFRQADRSEPPPAGTAPAPPS